MSAADVDAVPVPMHKVAHKRRASRTPSMIIEIEQLGHANAGSPQSTAESLQAEAEAEVSDSSAKSPVRRRPTIKPILTPKASPARSAQPSNATPTKAKAFFPEANTVNTPTGTPALTPSHTPTSTATVAADTATVARRVSLSPQRQPEKVRPCLSLSPKSQKLDSRGSPCRNPVIEEAEAAAIRAQRQAEAAETQASKSKPRNHAWMALVSPQFGGTKGTSGEGRNLTREEEMARLRVENESLREALRESKAKAEAAQKRDGKELDELRQANRHLQEREQALQSQVDSLVQELYKLAEMCDNRCLELEASLRDKGEEATALGIAKQGLEGIVTQLTTEAAMLGQVKQLVRGNRQEGYGDAQDQQDWDLMLEIAERHSRELATAAPALHALLGRLSAEDTFNAGEFEVLDLRVSRLQELEMQMMQHIENLVPISLSDEVAAAGGGSEGEEDQEDQEEEVWLEQADAVAELGTYRRPRVVSIDE
ncbi:unnamed protein product [Chrysoparadoxa australica]